MTLSGKEENARPNIRDSGVSMNYLGIDIGKNNHVASMLGDDGKSVFRAFSFSNTTEGAESLIAKLDSHNVRYDQVP